MRAGPLSDDRIIKILNSSFVPYYVTFQDYVAGINGVSKEESAEFNRIMAEFAKTNFSRGTVHVYVFTAGLAPLGTLHVAESAKIDVLLPFLNNVVSKLHVAAAPPSFTPRPQSAPPAAPKDSLVLHVFIRGLTLVTEFPHEDWVVLTPPEVQRLLPPPSAAAGTQWPLDHAASSKFGERLHPTLEWLVADPEGRYKTRIDNLDIQATMLPPTGEGVSIAKLEGKIQMFRPAYGYEPAKSNVRANLTGYMKFKDRRVLSFELIVKDAFYGDGSVNDREFEGYVEATAALRAPGASSVTSASN